MAPRREPETATIGAVTHDGRGIANTEGKKVFVAGALEGETVRFVRRKRRRNYDEAELLEILQPAAQRIAPRCAVFGTCGGCSVQHLSPPDQRTIKEQSLRDSMSRIGQVEPLTWLPPVFDDSEDGAFHYRRRARLAVKDVAGKGRVLVGFREKHAPFITDMHRCEVLAHPVDGLIDPLSRLIGSLSIRARLPQIEVAIAENRTTLVFRVLDPPTPEDLALFEQFGVDHDIEIGLQPGGMDSITKLDGATALSPLHYRLPAFDIDITFSANDFVQVNARVNRKMVDVAIDLLAIESSHSVLDLYCGIGNFSLPLARRGNKVLGIELASQQVARAKENAKDNALENCEFRCADLENIDVRDAWLAQPWDRLLLDPARSGAKIVAQHMNVIDPERIVYVSCHPGTLARDAGILVHEQNYLLEAAGIIDMFPHTGHVESLAVFRKK